MRASSCVSTVAYRTGPMTKKVSHAARAEVMSAHSVHAAARHDGQVVRASQPLLLRRASTARRTDGDARQQQVHAHGDAGDSADLRKEACV